ncbi:UNVERIFIED_CONTAM: hypothetical protein Slati_1470200 [Sesamum latifolium]|uniref:Reverse transcriptase domain-containing protein n=1 Tax=Sesamum latifolium TaxID=2727402 RepID=A0AAW2X5P8_9LAMI
MSPGSTVGLDGFNTIFYQRCWVIVKNDVVSEVQDFFTGAPLLLSFTATTIVLIPKVKNPSQYSEFRPISLCSRTNNILMKLLNNRLKSLLPSLVTLNQAALFFQIGDNILLAQEVMRSISANKKDWNVAFKLDMKKDYDRVDWSFLELILQRVGFPEWWIQHIWNYTQLLVLSPYQQISKWFL